MARRMFSDEITSTDAFLDMPSSSQLLYFQLGMSADDDGFIANPKMVMRVVGASTDDLKLLIAKKFILQFESGVCVVKHWRINNYIRKDIYKETKYLLEKQNLFIRENGSYSLNSENALPVPKGHFTLKETDFVDDTSTERALRIGKVRLGKVSKEDIKDFPLHKKINYLSQIPEEDLKEFTTRFSASTKQIKDKAESLLLYCQSKGKVYKDYKAFLLNAIKKDFSERQIIVKPVYEEVKVVMTPEQLKEIEEKRRQIRRQLTGK